MNGVNIESMRHAEVVAFIKNSGNETSLLVVDPDTDEHFKRWASLPPASMSKVDLKTLWGEFTQKSQNQATSSWDLLYRIYWPMRVYCMYVDKVGHIQYPILINILFSQNTSTFEWSSITKDDFEPRWVHFAILHNQFVCTALVSSSWDLRGSLTFFRANGAFEVSRQTDVQFPPKALYRGVKLWTKPPNPGL